MIFVTHGRSLPITGDLCCMFVPVVKKGENDVEQLEEVMEESKAIGKILKQSS